MACILCHARFDFGSLRSRRNSMETGRSLPVASKRAPAPLSGKVQGCHRHAAVDIYCILRPACRGVPCRLHAHLRDRLVLLSVSEPLGVSRMASCRSDGAVNSSAAVPCQMKQLTYLVWSWLPLKRPGKHSQRSVDSVQRRSVAGTSAGLGGVPPGKLGPQANLPLFWHINGTPFHDLRPVLKWSEAQCWRRLRPACQLGCHSLSCKVRLWH